MAHRRRSVPAGNDDGALLVVGAMVVRGMRFGFSQLGRLFRILHDYRHEHGSL